QFTSNLGRFLVQCGLGDNKFDRSVFRFLHSRSRLGQSAPTQCKSCQGQADDPKVTLGWRNILHDQSSFSHSAVNSDQISWAFSVVMSSLYSMAPSRYSANHSWTSGD